MVIDNIDIEATIEKARQLVDEDKELSASSKSIIEILILVRVAERTRSAVLRERFILMIERQCEHVIE